MQNLTIEQQQHIALTIINAEQKKPENLYIAESGAVSLKAKSPWKCTDGNNKAIEKGDAVTFWRSPEKDGKSCVNMYQAKKFFGKKKATATAQPAAPATASAAIEPPKAAIEQPKAPEVKLPAPKPPKAATAAAPVDNNQDTSSMESIIAAAKNNGAKSVMVAVVTF